VTVRTVAIVPAAGRGERMGADKALLDLAGTTAIERVVGTCLAAGVDEVLVVRRDGAAALPSQLTARILIVPAGGEMVRALGAMYAPVFGEWAQGVFLWGAFAVLYSTLFVAAAGNARMVADGLAMQRLGPPGGPPGSPAAADRAAFTRRISAVWVLVATGLAVAIGEPVAMVLASGVAQAIMLAALAVAVLWFRYRESDPRLAPPPAWDVLVWISAAGFLVIGLWTAWDKLAAVAWRV